MNAAIKKGKWPMIRVTYHGEKLDEIITAEDAMSRYGLSEKDLSWLYSPYMSGTSINKAPRRDHSVNMLHRYTEEDAHRDAAEEMLAALKEVKLALLKEIPAAHQPGRLLNVVNAALRKARAI